MAWNPLVIDVEDVPSLGIDVDTVESDARRLGDKASDLLVQVGRAKAAWGDIGRSYQTGHTEQVLAAVDDLWWASNLTRHVYSRSSWALGLLATDLRACTIEIDRLRGRVRTFRKQNFVDLSGMVPGSPAYITNMQLWIKARVIGGNVRDAIQHCKTRLDAIEVDPPRGDPYANTEDVFRNGWDRFRHDKVTLEYLDWELWGNSGSVRGDQVDQGNLGNCWFMSSLAALADNDPDAIKRMIRQRPDGSYAVKLFINGRWEEIVVDNAMLIGTDGKPQFAGDGDFNNQALWPLLIEKAAIKAHGDYYDLNAGRGAEAMEMLTGNEASHTYFDYNTPFDHIAIERFSALAADPSNIITASSVGGISTSSEIPSIRKDENGRLVDGPTVEVSTFHVYQVKDIDPQGNVTLINPHNQYASASDKVAHDYDEFTISAEHFDQVFHGLSVGRTD